MNSKAILNEVKDLFQDKDYKEAIDLLKENNLKMKLDELESIYFTRMSVSQRCDFWKNCCVERDEIIKRVTEKEIEEFKKHCEELQNQEEEYSKKIVPNLGSFKNLVPGGEVFIDGIHVSPLRPLPDLKFHLKNNDFPELLDAYYRFFVYLREYAFLMFLMFKYFEVGHPSSERTKLMQNLDEIGVLELKPSSLIPEKLIEYECDLIGQDIDDISQDDIAEFSVIDKFVHLVQEFEQELASMKRPRVESE